MDRRKLKTTIGTTLLTTLFIFCLYCLSYGWGFMGMTGADVCSGNFGEDFFTETSSTPLENHAPPCGGDWDETDSWETTDFTINSSGELTNEASGYRHTVFTESPSSNDNYGKIRGYIGGADSGYAMGVTVRGQDNASGAEDFIYCRIQGHTSSDQYMNCFTIVNGSSSDVGTTQSCGNLDESGTWYRLYVSASGSSPNITVTAWLKNDAESTTHCSQTVPNVAGPDSGSIGLMMGSTSSRIDWITTGSL